jgi:hypothetical protein
MLRDSRKRTTYSAFQDCLFLIIVVLLSLILYVWRLGFYSDDWAFLSNFSLSIDQTLAGLFRAANSPITSMRPVQVFYLAGLYQLFGSNPIGFHLVNAAVLLLGTLLFYLVLRELDYQRLFSLAIPLAYALLPHYSTDRFWVAAFQATLSMALYFLSLYADLRAVRSQQVRLWSWKLFSLISLLCSVLAYEVFLPLFFLNPLIVWFHNQQQYPSLLNKQPTRIKLAVLAGSHWLVLITVVVFKALTTNRMGKQADFGNHVVGIIKKVFSPYYSDYDYGLNMALLNFKWVELRHAG